MGNLGKGLAQKLQKLQNRAARIITGSDYTIRSSEILSDLNWSTLEQRRDQHLKLLFKTINKNVPDYLSAKFMPVNTIHKYSLRGADSRIFVPRPSTEKRSCGIAYLCKQLMLNQLLNLNTFCKYSFLANFSLFVFLRC